MMICTNNMLHRLAPACLMCSCALLLDFYLNSCVHAMPKADDVPKVSSGSIALTFTFPLTVNGYAAGDGAEQGSMQPNGQPKAPAGGPEKSSQLDDFSHEPQVPPLKLGILIFMFLCKYGCHSHSFHLALCCSPSRSCGMQGSCSHLHMFESASSV